MIVELVTEGTEVTGERYGVPALLPERAAAQAGEKFECGNAEDAQRSLWSRGKQ